MEPPENIGFRCDDCRSHPDPAFLNLPFEWFVGKHCKLAFSTGHPGITNELMWVTVTEVKEVEGTMLLVGFLDNDPIYVTDYSFGDGVGFERHEIHAVVAPEEGTSCTI